MQVTVLAHTVDPEQVVAMAARLCYSPEGIDSLRLSDAADDRQLIEKILNLGHYSVLEHASFTIGIEGVSRALSHQLVRHRIASFSQQSQRYVAFDGGFTYQIPPSIGGDEALCQEYRETMAGLASFYGRLRQQGVPAEDARFVLPNGADTRLVMTMNARELRHFFRLRCCRRAQWEIRALAVEILRQVRNISPLLFRDAGPACLAGPCPEGALSCGEASVVRQEFDVLQ
ncbi:MAG: FAD-dependent thymidylate synthase [Deltaproteobacteria bacterium]|nr:FAD-dependent thymidylate synthase [Candidatus Anaeroferrophillus wilburensis]MBN2888646.1 FAD-dependent thymidylate synthase [Deltaproteobacteria bacterium]